MKTISDWSCVSALFIYMLLTSGCATIIQGTTQEVGRTTDPPEANLCVDGRENYKSPAKITMKRKDDHIVEVTKEGFEKENINIKSVISGVVAGNLLLGGLIGIGVDALSGGANRLEPENINVRLRSSTDAGKESIEARLGQLEKLKGKGKITEEEYKKMRQEILANAGKEKIMAPAPPSPRIEPIPTEPPKAPLPKSVDKVAEEPSTATGP
jgi:hypothetical protein